MTEAWFTEYLDSPEGKKLLEDLKEEMSYRLGATIAELAKQAQCMGDSKE